MKDFLKKAWLPLLWAIGMIAVCFHDGAVPTTVGFLGQAARYGLGMVIFMAIWTFLVFLAHAARDIVRAWVNADPPSAEDFGEDAAYDAACAWRSINLAIGENYENVDACLEMGDLRDAGWHIEKSGSERAGFVYLKFIAPAKKK